MILALDQGTTSSRAIVFDGDGRITAVAQREFRQIFPQPGWVEHDPIEIWTTQLAVAHEAIAGAGLQPRDIKAIGITNQRETTVVWERTTGKPIHNAIVWQDRRTAAACERLESQRPRSHDHRQDRTARSTPISPAPRSHGCSTMSPAPASRAEAGELAFGTIDSWLIWNLTGGAVHATDATNASRTLLFNIQHRRLGRELLAWLECAARTMLPQVCASSGVIAETAPGLFGARIPIAGIAGDQQAALFGQRCIQPGMAKNTYGTGCFMLMNTGDEVVHSKHDCSVRSRAPPTAKDSTPSKAACSSAARWCNGCATDWASSAASSEIETLAASVPDNGGVYLVPAFTGLGAPHWDPYARGAIIGLTRGSSAAHIARAALESIAYQSADVLSAMVTDSGIELRELRVDGGASRNDAADAVPGRPARPARGAPADPGNDRAGRGVSGGTGYGLLEHRGATRCAVAGRENFRTENERGSGRGLAGGMAQGRRTQQRLGGINRRSPALRFTA